MSAMAGTGWSYFVDFMFPLPLVMLALLSIPMPAIIRQPARRAVLFICDKVLFLKVGSIPIIQLAILIAVVTFGATLSKLLQVSAAERAIDITKTGMEARDRARCMRWRHERNFWISVLSAILWIVLYRMYALMKEVQQLRRVEAGPVAATLEARDEAAAREKRD